MASPVRIAGIELTHEEAEYLLNKMKEAADEDSKVTPEKKRENVWTEGRKTGNRYAKKSRADRVPEPTVYTPRKSLRDRVTETTRRKGRGGRGTS